MANIGSLLVELSADVATFRQDMGRVSRIMDQQTRRIEQSGKRLDRMFQNIGRAAKFAFGAVAVGGLASFAQQAIASTDAMAKASARVGITAESFQELSLAFELGGSSARQFELGMQRLSRRLGDFVDDNKFSDAFEDLGFTRATAAAQTLEENLYQVADAVAALESEQAQLSATVALVDSEGASFVNTLRQGSEAIERQRQLARDLGIVLSNETAKGAEDAQDRLTLLGRIIKTNLTAAFLAVTPAVLQLARTFQEVLPPALEFVGRLFGRTMPVTMSATRVAMSETNLKIVELITVLDELGEKREEAFGRGSDQAASQIGTNIRALQEELRLEEEKFRQLQAQLDQMQQMEGALGRLSDIDLELNVPSVTRAASEPSAAPEQSQEAMAKLVTDLDAVSTKLPKVTEEFDRIDSAALSAGSAMSRAFAAASVGGERLGDVLQRLAVQLAELVFAQTVTNPLAGAISSALASGFSAGGSAAVSANAYPSFDLGTAGSFSQPTVTNNYINAIDVQSFEQRLVRSGRTISGIAQQGFAVHGNRVEIG